jgi:alpha-L-fucosidase
MSIPPYWQWFSQDRFGLFIHWGPYAVYGRGEQVLFREQIAMDEYKRVACAWNPSSYDPKFWAAVAKQAGMRYAVLTTRHHDGYCLFDTRFTDYNSAKQAPKRDLVREYVDAFRAAGLRVGLYYSLADWTNPAYFEGPQINPAGLAELRNTVHGQVRELLSNYGKIDVIWFDGTWPHPASTWGSVELIKSIRSLQPEILINNRLDTPKPPVGFQTKSDAPITGPAYATPYVEAAGESQTLGDFGTPEHHITATPGRLWESCNTSTWRLWGYTNGERFRPADVLLDFLTDAAAKGGNLLLNVGPHPEGPLPQPFVESMQQIGKWMDVHSECIYGSEGGDVTESVTYGRQIRKGNDLYLVFRFWPGVETFRVVGLSTAVRSAKLLTTGASLKFDQHAGELLLHGLPVQSPTPLFPVIKLSFNEPPQPIAPWATNRLWVGDPRVWADWSRGAKR